MAVGPRIDFGAGAVGFRLRSGEGRGGALARAIGVKPGRAPAVVDATAGLGRDGFVLASLGCTVTLIERVPAVHDALAAALAQARAGAPDLALAASRITLLAGDARALLAGLAPETVLIDPMHPERRSAALVKQPLRDLRAIVGGDDDAAELLAVALCCARRRVVLKWPLRAAPLAAIRAPSHCIAGRTVRYDVFVLG